MGPGLPEKVAKEDLDLNNFFGFVEVTRSFVNFSRANSLSVLPLREIVKPVTRQLLT